MDTSKHMLIGLYDMILTVRVRIETLSESEFEELMIALYNSGLSAEAANAFITFATK